MLNNKVRLGDLIEVLTDYHANGAYKKLKENVELLDDEDYALMVRTTNFENNDFHDSVKYINEHAYNFLDKSKVYPNDLIMNKIANAGSIYLMPDLKRPVSLAMNLFLIRVNEKLANPIYVYLYLKINEHYVKQFANGSVTKTITKEAVRNLEIFLPSREEQDIIVHQYMALENKINLNLRINQNLESIAQTIFKSWFIDFEPVRAKIAVKQEGKDPELAAMCVISRKNEAQLEQMGKEDFSELQATAALFSDEMQKSELGQVPRGWNINNIGSVANIVKGKSYKSSELNDSEVALVTLKSFNRGGGYRLDGLKEFTGSYKAEQEVFPGELVISYTDVTQSADIIGKPALVIADPKYKHLVISLDVAVVRPHKVYYKNFLYGLAKTRSFQLHTKAHASGTTVLHLSKNAIPDFHFVNASEEVLKKYEEITMPIFKKINQLIQENRTLNEIKLNMLPKLLSGEINSSLLNKI